MTPNPRHYSVRVLADSINESLNRLTTFELTYPRFIHSEFMTHRMLSRNAASSRAIPTLKLLEQVEDDPVYPLSWGKNCKGMSSKEPLGEYARHRAMNEWQDSAFSAAAQADSLLRIGVHKQITNRLLEPFLPITVIATGTEWGNFLHLRDSAQAQPEIAWVAREVRRALELSVPSLCKPGDWHRPLVSDDEDHPHYVPDYKCPNQISAARCARVSYLTHDGERDLKADLELYERLTSAGHWSPLEHVAMCMGTDSRWGNFYGWKQLRKTFDNENFGRKQD